MLNIAVVTRAIRNPDGKLGSRAAAAWLTSLAVHAALAASLWYSAPSALLQAPRLDGRRETVTLEATWSVPQPDVTQTLLDTEPQVVVRPNQVVIGERRYARTPAEPPVPELTVLPEDDAAPADEQPPAPQPPSSLPLVRAGLVSEAAPPPGVEDETAPRPLDNPPPVYPARARFERLAGTVTLRLTIAVDGSVTTLEVEHSSGHAILDAAAMRAVRVWRFEPARRGNAAMPWTGLLPIRFTLE